MKNYNYQRKVSMALCLVGSDTNGRWEARDVRAT